MPFNQFQAGAIHSKNVFDFWKTELEASEWVLFALEYGYVIPFLTEPTIYQERNNLSARENMQEVRKQMEEMIRKGIVKIVPDPPYCINPLGMVSKTQEDGTIKHRLVWDGSRHVNKHLAALHVRLAHLERALEITNPGDFQVVFDLSSAYYHIKIHPSQTKFLGAAFENEDGKQVFVEYQVLPFGLASAVHAITKIMKPIISFITGKGILH